MNQEANKVKCPNCGFELDVNEILYHQLDEELKQKYNDDLAKERKKFDQERLAVKLQLKELEDERSKMDERVSKMVKAGLTDEKQKLQVKLKKQIEEEQAERFSDLEKELDQKSKQVKELNKSKAEIERLTSNEKRYARRR
jgi:flagellar biosynthesis chaperone FliJ